MRLGNAGFWMALTSVAIGCNPITVELDPGYEAQIDFCEFVDCDDPPRCPSGNTDCVACLCCPCLAGETRCDTSEGQDRLRCVDGCFIDDPCGDFEVCVANEAGAECQPTAFDCDTMEWFELLAICDENEALCDECGCFHCTGVVSQVCEIGTSDIRRVLTCDDARGCFVPTACASGEACYDRMDGALAQCESKLRCDQLYCTGLQVCGEDPSNCGPCGCCAFSDAPPFCNITQFGEQAVYTWQSVGSCFQVTPCGVDEDCTYNIFDQPVCE